MKYWIAIIGTLAAVSTGAAAADTKAAKAATVIPAPAAGKGQVIFWRPGGLVGAAIRCTIRENGTMVARLGPGKFYAFTAEPGPHKFTTATEATDTLNIEAEPDENQYVKCKIGMGVMAGRPNLSPSTQAEFGAKSAKLKPVDAADLAKMQAEEAAERAKKAK